MVDTRTRKRQTSLETTTNSRLEAGKVGDSGEEGQDETVRLSASTSASAGNGRHALMKTLLFGCEPSADVAAIALVYFVQGVIGLASLATSYFLKDDLGLDPTQLALLEGASAAPWLIKPVYGIITDGVPIMGYRRKPYLFACGIIGAAGYGLLASGVSTPSAALGALVLSSAGVAASDVIVDSVVVEKAREGGPEMDGSLQSLSWGARAVGSIASASVGGTLVALKGPRFVFAVTAALPMLVSAVALLLNEDPVGQKTTTQEQSRQEDANANGDSNGNFNGNISTTKGLSKTRLAATGATESLNSPSSSSIRVLKQQAAELWSAVSRRDIWAPAIFMFCWQATPSAGSAMFFFQTNELGFTPEFLGQVELGCALASLGGVALYNTAFKAVPLRKMFLYSAVVGTAMGFSQLLLVTGVNAQLGISNETFAFVDAIALTVIAKLAFMPVLVLAARTCPEGVEATLFALLMSVLNGGGVTGGAAGALLTQKLGVTGDDFNNLALLLVICNASSLLPLPLLGLVPTEEEIARASKKRAKMDD